MATPLNVFRGQRPDITAAQLLGVLAVAAGPVCQLAGMDLSREDLQAVDDLKVLGLGLIGADAALRIGRNLKDGRVEAAALAVAGEPSLGSLPAAGVAEAPLPETGVAEAPLPETGVGAEAPLEAAEIEDLAGDAGTDDAGTDDLDDLARAIAEEELAGVPEDDEP